MWPLKKKSRYPGMQADKAGNFTFVLTEEEKNAVEEEFTPFKGYYLRPDIKEQTENALVARGLAHYAERQIMLSTFDSHKTEMSKLIDKAIAAISKAYSYYSLPIYLYDLACFMEMAGQKEKARDIFRDFLDTQGKYKPAEIDQALLLDRDINDAIRKANLKVTMID